VSASAGAVISALPDRTSGILSKSVSHLIGGDLVRGDGSDERTVIDPSSGEPIRSIQDATAEDVDRAITDGLRAHASWAAIGFYERSRILSKVADVIEENAAGLALLDSLESGNPLRAMEVDVALGVKHLRMMAAMGMNVRGETFPAEGGGIHFTEHSPYGVVVRIIPFNHPAMFAIAKVAAPLMAGNSVVSLSALYVGTLLQEHLPPGVVNVVTGGASTGAALIQHPAVKRISFIGSVPTGLKVQVCQGQSCGSNSRVFVHADIYSEFLDAVVEELRAIKVGPAYERSSDMGPVVDSRQYERVLDFIDHGREVGRLVSGGMRPDGVPEGGYFVNPALIDRLPQHDRLAQEEVFGPVVSLFRWEDPDAVLHAANDIEYGLTASVWTSHLDRAHLFARGLEAGYVWINEHGRHYIGAPFGGFKASGVGEEESFSEIASFMQTKSIHVKLPDAVPGAGSRQAP
jgi:acyl-CoA reductase-like NAD-dependent aldehyde dehydrogenase